jgi:hypothetical protein
MVNLEFNAEFDRSKSGVLLPTLRGREPLVLGL